jgi:hypothetical protein
MLVTKSSASVLVQYTVLITNSLEQTPSWARNSQLLRNPNIYSYLYKNQLLVFQRKILRRIFGLTKENQVWRVRTNEELDKLIKHKNIISYVKAQRLSWFGHVQRMPDTRTVTKIFNWKYLIKRSQGRPKYRWEDNIKHDICQMKIKNWIAYVQDRGNWKEVVEKANTFN